MNIYPIKNLRSSKLIPPHLGERSFTRKSLPPWDEKWHGLSRGARLAFLDHARVSTPDPTSRYGGPPERGGVPSDTFHRGDLDELVAAGFLEVRALSLKTKTVERAFAPRELLGFLTRVRALHRHHPLAADGQARLEPFLNVSYYGEAISSLVVRVVLAAGVKESYLNVGEALKRYVTTRYWPGWTLAELKDPLADRILRRVREGGAPRPIVDLAAEVEPGSPAAARAAIDDMIKCLILFEDLNPETLDLVVDLLPKVRAHLDRADRPRVRPPLVPVEVPREVGPEAGPIINDLRGFLLEVASEPPRTRQDLRIFQKDLERFEEGLDPLPPWLAEFLRWPRELRVERLAAWARLLGLVRDSRAEDRSRLEITATGQSWLSGDLASQYLALFAPFQKITTDDYDSPFDFWDDDWDDDDDEDLWPLEDLRSADPSFFGLSIEVATTRPGKGKAAERISSGKDVVDSLRRSVFDALRAFPTGQFFPLDLVLDHACFGPSNPLNLGLDPKQVLITCEGQSVPALEELREDVARTVFEAFLKTRLIPLGCVQAAIDSQGRIGIARRPRLDAFFGRDVDADAVAGSSMGDAKVVVQPDFSVVIIGLNPAPAAALAPFCERAKRGGGQGALVLKISRESVLKAIAGGMSGETILERLEKFATVAVPPNVLREVREWGGWVRRVTTETLAVIRCPDRDTADRVMGALKRHGERLNDTLVALDVKALTPVERARLQDHGILVGKATRAAREDRDLKTPKGTRKAKRKRS